jgi:uncharacterized DUF497 family protein
MRTNDAIDLSPKVAEKLANKKPPVTVEEIEQCFATRQGHYLEDQREEHASDPPTMWFIGETYFGRRLKVVFIARDSKVVIRTAYPPNEEEVRIYEKYGRKQSSPN